MNTITLKPNNGRPNDELDKAYCAMLDVIEMPALGALSADSITGRYLQTLLRINDPSEPGIFRLAQSARREAVHGMEALSQHAQALAQAMRRVMERAGESVTTTRE